MLTRIYGKKKDPSSGKAERRIQQMGENRVAALSIIVEPGGDVDSLNRILTEYRRYVVGRMGIPYRERGISIISVVMDGPQNEIAAISGRIGNLPRVKVKTAYSGVTG